MGAMEEQVIRHKIGATRTVQTAVLVCAYLRERLRESNISFYATNASDQNGFWVTDIIVTNHALSLEKSSELVEACRAFVAGRGEIWA